MLKASKDHDTYTRILLHKVVQVANIYRYLTLAACSMNKVLLYGEGDDTLMIIYTYKLYVNSHKSMKYYWVYSRYIRCVTYKHHYILPRYIQYHLIIYYLVIYGTTSLYTTSDTNSSPFFYEN